MVQFRAARFCPETTIKKEQYRKTWNRLMVGFHPLFLLPVASDKLPIQLQLIYDDGAFSLMFDVLYVAHPGLQFPTSCVAAAALWNQINSGIHTDMTRFSIFWPLLDLWTCLSVVCASRCILTFQAYELLKALK